MNFTPPKTTGLLIGLAALAVCLVVGAAGLVGLATEPGSLTGVAALAALLLAGPAGAWLTYRLAGLLNARYQLSPDALTVEWGGRREVIPLTDIEEAHPAALFPGPLPAPRLSWPGCVVGEVQQPELGALEYLATTTAKAGLVLIGYPGGWLALSPADPAGFLAALTAAQTEEWHEPVPAESVTPRLAEWALWRDKLALGLILAGGAALAGLLLYLALIYPQLPPQIALRFGSDGQPAEFGTPAGLLALARAGALAWGANTLLGVFLHRRPQDRAAAYLLFGGAVGVQALLWVATLGLLTAGL